MQHYGVKVGCSQSNMQSKYKQNGKAVKGNH